MKIIITSMYANPIHPGHIECCELAKQLGDQLWVIVNSDYQAFLKRGKPSFQDEAFRLCVVGALKPVDRAVLATDKDGSVCETLERLINEARQLQASEVIFAKGGDRFASEIPERVICDRLNVKIVDGLGEKTHSSSEILLKLTEASE